jgi:hypothetical protein
MKKIFIMLQLIFLGVLPLMASAEDKYSEARGQLLYTAHCNACHTSQIHWRDQKLVTDWESLLLQVRRWQYITALNWSDDEISDVALHLDRLFYKYKATAQNRKPAQLMHGD